MIHRFGLFSQLCSFFSLSNRGVNFKRRAFTLTEWLISLVVVAVIAVLIFPVITTRAQNRSFALNYESEVKQMLNSLEGLPVNENKQDFKHTMMFVENDTGHYADSAGEYINKYMKVVKYCGDVPGDCFADKYFEYVNRDKVAFNRVQIKGACALLKNGVSVCLKPQIKNENGKEEISGWIDLNGPNGPNIYGRDLREFSINLTQRAIFSPDEIGGVVIPDPPTPCEGEACPKPNPCQVNPQSEECCKKRGTVQDEKDVCCIWYSEESSGPNYAICNPTPPTSCENVTITDPSDECCKVLENVPECCTADDTSDYCCTLHPTSEGCCKKNISLGKITLTPNHACCKYESISKNYSACEFVCAPEQRDTEQCCKTEERGSEIGTPDDKCCQYPSINGTGSVPEGSYTKNCCRLPKYNTSLCCKWKSNHLDYYTDSCCSDPNVGIENAADANSDLSQAARNHILSTCCKVEQGSDAVKKACCSRLVKNDEDLKGALSYCCQYDDFKNKPQCCSSTEDGKTAGGIYSSQCCMPNPPTPDIRCCFDSSYDWSGNRLSGCCSLGNGTYDGKKANAQDKWQLNCCSQGSSKYPSVNSFNDNCCGIKTGKKTVWTNECCSTLLTQNPGNNGLASWKQNCCRMPDRYGNNATYRENCCKDGTDQTFKNGNDGTNQNNIDCCIPNTAAPTKACCEAFKANAPSGNKDGWLGKDNEVITDDYKQYCCTNHGVCPDDCAIKSKVGDLWNTSACCFNATVMADHMSDSKWANTCCSSAPGKISDSQFKQYCCSAQGKKIDGTNFAGCCDYSKAVLGTPCCSSQGKKLDGTNFAGCCDYSKAVLGTPCCSSQGKNANNSNFAGCCDYSKAVLGTPCCSSQGKNANNADFAGCCDYTKTVLNTPCCSGQGKNANNADFVGCCDYSKAVLGTPCCKAQGIKSYDNSNFAGCCNPNGEATDFCCKTLSSNAAYQQKCCDKLGGDYCPTPPTPNCLELYNSGTISDECCDELKNVDHSEDNHLWANKCCKKYVDNPSSYSNFASVCCTGTGDGSVFGTDKKSEVCRVETCTNAFENNPDWFDENIKTCCFDSEAMANHGDKDTWKDLCCPERSPSQGWIEACCFQPLNGYYHGGPSSGDGEPTKECCPEPGNAADGGVKACCDKYRGDYCDCTQRWNRAKDDKPEEGGSYSSDWWGRKINNLTDTNEEACCAHLSGDDWVSGCCSIGELTSGFTGYAEPDSDKANCCRAIHDTSEKASHFYPGSPCCTALNNDSKYPECQSTCSDESIYKSGQLYYSDKAKECCTNKSGKVADTEKWKTYCCLLTATSDTSSESATYAFPIEKLDEIGCCEKRKTSTDVYAYIPFYYVSGNSCPAGGVYGKCGKCNNYSKKWWCGDSCPSGGSGGSACTITDRDCKKISSYMDLLGDCQCHCDTENLKMDCRFRGYQYIDKYKCQCAREEVYGPELNPEGEQPDCVNDKNAKQECEEKGGAYIVEDRILSTVCLCQVGFDKIEESGGTYHETTEVAVTNSTGENCIAFDEYIIHYYLEEDGQRHLIQSGGCPSQSCASSEGIARFNASVERFHNALEQYKNSSHMSRPEISEFIVCP